MRVKVEMYWQQMVENLYYQIFFIEILVPPRTTTSSPSKIKEHYELFAYQCAGYKVFINMYLKAKSKARDQKAE